MGTHASCHQDLELPLMFQFLLPANAQKELNQLTEKIFARPGAGGGSTPSSSKEAAASSTAKKPKSKAQQKEYAACMAEAADMFK